MREAVLALVLLVASLAGCIGTDDAAIDEASTDEIDTAQGEPVEATEATRELQEKGYEDPYLDTEPTGEVHEYDFWVNQDATLNPYGDLTLGAAVFATGPNASGQVPAPEIRVTQGDTVRVNLHLEAGPFGTHTMHWHGYDVPWRSDGVPAVTQPLNTSGESVFTYEFVAKQPGTYWYHCVVLFPVHLEGGMFGPLIVEPQDGPELPYDREETLMFHEVDSQYFTTLEWLFNPNVDPDPGRISENPVDAVDSAERNARHTSDEAGLIVEGMTGQETWSEGPRDYYPARSIRYQPSYDTFMINGKSYPDTEPIEIGEGETVRLRLINAGQLHKSIHLHGHHFLVTHKDGYPLEDPRWEDTVNLAPGERKDVYVQGTNPGIWKLHDHSGSSGMGTTNANDYAFPGGQITAMVYEDFQPPEGLPAGDDTGQATAGDYAVHADGGGR